MFQTATTMMSTDNSVMYSAFILFFTMLKIADAMALISDNAITIQQSICKDIHPFNIIPL